MAQNQTDPLKPKRTITLKAKVTADNSENISNRDKTNISFQSDDVFVEKTVTSHQFESAGTSSLSDSNNWFNSSLKSNSSIICRSIDQDETLNNETTYIDNENIIGRNEGYLPQLYIGKGILAGDAVIKNCKGKAYIKFGNTNEIPVAISQGCHKSGKSGKSGKSQGI